MFPKDMVNLLLPIQEEITEFQTIQMILRRLSQILLTYFFENGEEQEISQESSFLYMSFNYKYIYALVLVINDYCMESEKIMSRLNTDFKMLCDSMEK